MVTPVSHVVCPNLAPEYHRKDTKQGVRSEAKITAQAVATPQGSQCTQQGARAPGAGGTTDTKTAPERG